jgi:xanthine dehydrogenase large subunit
MAEGGARKSKRAAPQSIAGAAIVHDSGEKHVAGAAPYIDDLPEPAGTLHIQLGMSARAHARIVSMDLAAVRAAPDVVAVLGFADVPGKNDASPHAGDEPLLAETEVLTQGQTLFAVAAKSRRAARHARKLAKVGYEDLPAAFTIAQAREAGLIIEAPVKLERGGPDAAITKAPHRLSGQFELGGQEHFYLEGQIALAVPGEGDEMLVYSSTQNPTEVQMIVARVLGVPAHAVTIEVRRMGGGFGGKETQPAQVAAIAALVARKTGRAAKLRLDRDDDMASTGKRHDFEFEFDVGFDDDGRIQGIAMDQHARCGFSADLSRGICDRAVFHADNCYYLPAVRITSHRWRTHTVSNTAFRGFGGPQGMIAIEHVMDCIAHALGKDPLDVRKANLYGPGRDLTPYGQRVEEETARKIMEALEDRSDYRERRERINEWNAKNPWMKRGIALTPVKFGISFTLQHLNQAGALVHVYADGSIQLNHGGTEMGQGLMIKVAQVVANEFATPLERVKIMATSTAKVPNTSPTAASSGSDLNGMAARDACLQIKASIAAHVAKGRCKPEDVRFEAGRVIAGNQDQSWEEAVKSAYMARTKLFAAGYYATPKIHFDRTTFSGRPFLYYAYGAAVSEAAIDLTTGETRILRVDILHDCGKSLNPAIDRGQIEGGFIQGMGWLTTEELVFDGEGRLRTHAPSTYKIPTAGDRPPDFRIDFWDEPNPEETIYRSKAVGEPPLMLPISAFSAIWAAVAAARTDGSAPKLDAPATPERVLLAAIGGAHA